MQKLVQFEGKEGYATIVANLELIFFDKSNLIVYVSWKSGLILIDQHNSYTKLPCFVS